MPTSTALPTALMHVPTIVTTPKPTPQPQPGVTVASGVSTHVVYEDGSATSSFTIALDTVPLSDVTITFSAASSKVSMSPASVVFTWQNFDAAVTVVVSAVGDSIDQGTTHSDSVLISVSSLDSLTKCSRAGRSACHQAVSYDGFAVDSLVVTVTDDDEAGVRVTTSDGADMATYDNFGDVLTAATYALVLSSEPTEDVTVTVGGLGPYTVADPSSVVFNSSNWNQAVTVKIFASASSAHRPVCADGTRYCDAIASRTESVTHAATSSDSNYHGATVAGVSVAVEVVHDDADPPKVASAKFSNLLNAALVTFNSTTDRAGLAGSFECTAFLNKTAAEVEATFGTGAMCSFSSATVLKVTFGSEATVVPSDVLLVKDMTIQAATASASLFTTREFFALAGPDTPTVPSVVLFASSTSVGSCDDLTLDGSASSGSGGRDMVYSFSVASASGHSVANLTAALAEANAENAGSGTYKVNVPSSAMVPGSSFTVTLTATNFLSESSSVSVTVKKLGVPAPIISIQGSNPRTDITHSDALSLEASAELPTMTCVDSDLSSAKMSFLWFEDTGLFSGALSGTSKNPRELAMAVGDLAASTSYSFRVVGFMTDTPSLNNSATVDVQVGQQDLVAVVAGGASRQAGRDAAFIMDGSGSYDPDEDSEAFSHAWACADSSANDCGITLASASTATVAAEALAIGTYTFTLTVTKGSRNNSASVSVEVTAGAPPAVSIAALANDKYNADDGFSALTATVSSSRDLSFTTAWSATDSDVSAPFVSGGAAVATASKLTTVVGLGRLTEGSTYTLRLTATDTDGSSAYAEVTLTMNSAPSSGAVVVAPLGGFALDTAFAFSSLNWVDEDLPLTYVFGTTDVNIDGSLDTSSLYPFGNAGSDASVSEVTLSAGANGTNFTVGCFTEAYDSYGAAGSATTSVRVRNKHLKVAQLFNISEAKASEALDGGNADAAKQVLAATTEGMKTTSTDASSSLRRRSPLAGSDAEALRASVLANLWSTYDITPVTQADVASLLSVLVGVVDTPAEVDDATAASALNFLTTVLNASAASGVGISATAAGLAGTALTSLFDTSVFGASGGTASYGFASAALAALRLASANQLHGALEGVGYALSSGDLDAYSYRSAAGDLNSLGALQISSGGASSDMTTSVAFSAAAEAAMIAAATGATAATVWDFKVATLDSNVYAYALDGTSGTAAALASRLDQAVTSGDTLLRSKLTVVEMSAQDGSTPLASLTGLSAAIEVTLAATVPFTVDLSAFEKNFVCATDGASIDLGCPLTTETHTCDFAANGNGGKYFFVAVCPYVAPTCLWWDSSTAAFSAAGCSVQSGYRAGAVTCECDHLTTFALGAEATTLEVTAQTTPAPTLSPSPLPTVPSPRPTSSSTSPAPTTPAPTLQATVSASVALYLDASAAATDANKATLKATLATELGVAQAAIKGFEVNSSRRRRRRLLASTWSVGFSVQSSTASDAAALASSVLATLQGASFDSNLVSALPGVVTGVASVSTSSVDRSAPSPTPSPVALGTTTTTATTSTSTSKSSSGSNTGTATAAAGAVGAVLLVIAAVALFK